MAVGVFGVPSVFTTLCLRLTRRLLFQAFGYCEPIRISALKNIKPSWRDNNSESTLFFSEIPEPELIQFLIEKNASLIAFLSSFEANVRELIEQRTKPPLEAIRKTSRCMAALEEVIFAPNVFIIRSGGNRKIEVRKLLTQLAAFLGLNPQILKVERIIEGLELKKASDGNVYLEDQLNRSFMLESGHAASDVRDVEWPAELISALMGYNSILELNAISKVHWPAKLFSMDKNSSNLVTKAFPLLGPARFLVYGPRLGLPKGKWMATVSLAVADNSSGNRIAVAISQNQGQKVLANGETELPPFGTYSCELPFVITAPHLPIEVRLAIKQGAIEGEFSFLGVDLKRNDLRCGTRPRLTGVSGYK